MPGERIFEEDGAQDQLQRVYGVLGEKKYFKYIAMIDIVRKISVHVKYYTEDNEVKFVVRKVGHSGEEVLYKTLSHLRKRLQFIDQFVALKQYKEIMRRCIIIFKDVLIKKILNENNSQSDSESATDSKADSEKLSSNQKKDSAPSSSSESDSSDAKSE